MLGAFSDFGKADPEIYRRMVYELFMEYTQAVVVQAAKQVSRHYKWLPTISEIKEILDDIEDPGRKFRLPPSPWPELKPEPAVPETSVERRKEVVRQELGYNPKEASSPQAIRSQHEYEKRQWARKYWAQLPAYHYPLEWLMLTPEERWEREAKGEAPVAERVR